MISNPEVSNLEVKRTLATLHKIEFGFLGVIVDVIERRSILRPKSILILSPTGIKRLGLILIK